MQCVYAVQGSKNFIFYIIHYTLYIIVALLCPAFLKRADFYKAHRSKKRGVDLWLIYKKIYILII